MERIKSKKRKIRMTVTMTVTVIDFFFPHFDSLASRSVFLKNNYLNIF